MTPQFLRSKTGALNYERPPFTRVRRRHERSQTLIGLLQTELSTTNREVMLLTLELEERIAERMAQLSQTNQELLKEISERRHAEEEVSKLNRQLEQRPGATRPCCDKS
jgi:C4-dicarboxylate-specific signal transduction histidine kinase